MASDGHVTITFSNYSSTVTEAGMNGLLASLILFGVVFGFMALLTLAAWLGLYFLSRRETRG